MEEVTEKSSDVPPASRGDLFKKQNSAGMVIDGVRRPDLTTPEVKALTDINIPDKEVLSEADRALLLRQANAGIGGNPPLKEAEVRRLAEIHSRTPTGR